MAHSRITIKGIRKKEIKWVKCGLDDCFETCSQEATTSCLKSLSVTLSLDSSPRRSEVGRVQVSGPSPSRSAHSRAPVRRPLESQGGPFPQPWAPFPPSPRLVNPENRQPPPLGPASVPRPPPPPPAAPPGNYRPAPTAGPLPSQQPPAGLRRRAAGSSSRPQLTPPAAARAGASQRPGRASKPSPSRQRCPRKRPPPGPRQIPGSPLAPDWGSLSPRRPVRETPPPTHPPSSLPGPVLPARLARPPPRPLSAPGSQRGSAPPPPRARRPLSPAAAGGGAAAGWVPSPRPQLTDLAPQALQHSDLATVLVPGLRLCRRSRRIGRSRSSRRRRRHGAARPVPQPRRLRSGARRSPAAASARASRAWPRPPGRGRSRPAPPRSALPPPHQGPRSRRPRSPEPGQPGANPPLGFPPLGPVKAQALAKCGSESWLWAASKPHWENTGPHEIPQIFLGITPPCRRPRISTSNAQGNSLWEEKRMEFDSCVDLQTTLFRRSPGALETPAVMSTCPHPQARRHTHTDSYF